MSEVFLLMLYFKREGGYMVKILRSVFIDEMKVARLNRLSATTRIPKAALVREGVDLMLEKHEEKFKRKHKKRGGT
jgi:hypothetical protein